MTCAAWTLITLIYIPGNPDLRLAEYLRPQCFDTGQECSDALTARRLEGFARTYKNTAMCDPPAPSSRTDRLVPTGER